MKTKQESHSFRVGSILESLQLSFNLHCSKMFTKPDPVKQLATSSWSHHNIIWNKISSILLDKCSKVALKYAWNELYSARLHLFKKKHETT